MGCDKDEKHVSDEDLAEIERSYRSQRNSLLRIVRHVPSADKVEIIHQVYMHILMRAKRNGLDIRGEELDAYIRWLVKKRRISYFNLRNRKPQLMDHTIGTQHDDPHRMRRLTRGTSVDELEDLVMEYVPKFEPIDLEVFRTWACVHKCRSIRALSRETGISYSHLLNRRDRILHCLNLVLSKGA